MASSEGGKIASQRLVFVCISRKTPGLSVLSARKLVSKKSWGKKWILRLHYNLKSIINTKGNKKKELKPNIRHQLFTAMRSLCRLSGSPSVKLCDAGSVGMSLTFHEAQNKDQSVCGVVKDLGSSLILVTLSEQFNIPVWSVLQS